MLNTHKLRVSDHKLEIESGQYKNISADERYCRICKSNQIADEFHFKMCCRVYIELRTQLFQQTKDFVPVFDTLPIFEKLIFLMSADDLEVLTQFIKMCKNVLQM